MDFIFQMKHIYRNHFNFCIYYFYEMNLRETILSGHSKTQTMKIVNWVGNSQARFDELFKLFLNSEYRIVQRSAWPISYCVIEHPNLIKKYFKQLIEQLKKPGLHVAVRRNIVRLLQHIEIPLKYHGEIMDICFKFIASHEEAVAVKAFSITVLQKLSAKYPQIRQEINLIIQERWDFESNAFKTRAEKLLNSSFP